MISPAGSLYPKPTSLYKYYDSHDVLLYVGITSVGLMRNRQHNSDKEWWPIVATQTVEHCQDRAAALERERELIQQFLPPFNKHHNPNHEALRSAYLFMRESGRFDTPVKTLIASGDRKWIPLAALYLWGDHVLFRPTRYDDAQLFAHVRVGADAKTEVFTASGGNRVGSFVRVSSDRREAGVVAHIQPWRGRAVAGRLRLGFVSLKDPMVIEAKRLFVEFSE